MLMDFRHRSGKIIILMLVKAYIATRRTNLETNDISCLWLEIIPKKGKSFRYIEIHVEWVDHFKNSIDVVLKER